MLAATSFSLVLPSIEYSNGNVIIPALGILVGAFCITLVDKFTPHLHFISGPEGPSSSLRKINKLSYPNMFPKSLESVS